MKTKEQVYDEQIGPLMAQIIAICQARGISMIASFAIEDPDVDGEERCSTLLPDGDGKFEPDFAKAARVMGFPSWRGRATSVEAA